MVPRRSAHSSGVIRSSPWAPSSTTSSPACTAPSGPDVDHHLVHRHHADDRVPPAADEHLLAARGRAARNTPSAYPIGQRGDDACRARRGGAARRRSARRPRTGFTKDTSRGERGRPGAARRGRRSAGRRRDAVDGDAAAHEVVAGGRVGDGGRPSWPRGASARRCPAAASVGQRRRRSASSCAAVNGSSGSSATAKWVHTPVEAQARVRRRSAGPGRRASAGRRTDPVHAGVDLEVHRAPAAARRRPRAPSARDQAGGVDGDGARRRPAPRPPRSGRGSDSSRIGASMPAARSARRLGHLGDGQPGGAGLERRPGRPGRRRGRTRRPSRPRRPRPGAATPRASAATLARDRRRGRHRRPTAIGRHQRRAAPRRSAPGRQVEQVAGHEPARPGRAPPARPCSQAPAAAASSGGDARARGARR